MKLIFGFLMFVAAVAITGGLYLAIRKPEQKKADLERLDSVCSQIANRLQRLGDYLVRLYTVTVAMSFPAPARNGPACPNSKAIFFLPQDHHRYPAGEPTRTYQHGMWREKAAPCI